MTYNLIRAREEYVIHRDAIFIPVEQLSDIQRERLDHKPGDAALTIKRGRMLSKLLNKNTQDFLSHFKKPCTIVDAVITHAKQHDLEPEFLLEKVVPMLETLVQEGALHLSSDGATLPELKSQYENVDYIGSYSVISCLMSRQDGEIYKVRDVSGTPYIIKISRWERDSNHRDNISEQIIHEAKLLEELGGRVTPALIELSEHERKVYLVMEYCDYPSGEHAMKAVLRDAARPEAKMIRIAQSIADAYANIHECGIIHEDVHSSNILINSKTQKVKVLDFGSSRFITEQPEDKRDGIMFFFDPTYAKVRLDGIRGYPSDVFSDQYSVAAVIFYILAQEHHLPFSLKEEEILQQIATMPSRSIRNFVPGLPEEIDSVLLRALNKDPKKRFRTMREFSNALQDIKVNDTSVAFGKNILTKRPALEDHFLLPQSGYFEATQKYSFSSIAFGASGVAYYLLRRAQLFQEHDCLMIGDIWSKKSLSYINDDRGFFSEQEGLKKEDVPLCSYFYGATGVYVVDALLQIALANKAGADTCIQKILELHQEETLDTTTHLDLNIGSVGVLLALITIYKSYYNDTPPIEDIVPAAKIVSDLENHLCQLSVDDPESPILFLGLAHGWAGIFYVLLSWYEFIKQPPPSWIIEKMKQHLNQGLNAETTLAWPVAPFAIEEKPNEDGFGSFLCNGNSGQIIFLLKAYNMVGDVDFLQAAEMSTQYVIEEAVDYGESMCCGRVGYVYALIYLYRITKNPVLKENIQKIIASIKETGNPFALYKADLGFTLLKTELAAGIEHVTLPLFENPVES